MPRLFDFTPGEQQLLGYWDRIIGGTMGRQTTAKIWQSVRADAQRDGVRLRASARDMNRLRAIANTWRTSRDNIASARPGSSIDASMIASAPWSSPLASSGANLRIEVRFEHIVSVDGREVTRWRTKTNFGSLPRDADGFRRKLDRIARGIARGYIEGHVGIGDVIITSV